jgi:hypothetical protein
MAWTVDFFVDSQDNAPVESFLMLLPSGHRAKSVAIIKLLELQGPTLPFPYSSQVGGKLRELRTQQGKDKLRILYFADSRRVFVLLHAILKKDDKLPEGDIRIAEERMQWHTKRLEGKLR